MCELGSGDECVCVCVHVCILLSTPPFCIWKGSWDKPRVESSHIYVGSPTLLPQNMDVTVLMLFQLCGHTQVMHLT